MAPRGRRKAGLMRDDAARDAMRNFGFDERVIDDTIKELLELYGGEEAWKLIEDGSYSVLLTRCLENQEQQERQVKQEEEREHHELVVQEQEPPHDLVLQEQEEHVETDALSTTTETVMDTSPTPLLVDYGYRPVEGAGWISDEDTDPEEDGHGDNAPAPADDDDDDDAMIQLTPEPLCEELQELLREVQAQKKRKRV